jgi:hypothetical protein
VGEVTASTRQRHEDDGRAQPLTSSWGAWRGEALHARLAGRWRFGWVYASVWLVYLISPLSVALHTPQRWSGAAGAVCVVAFATVYVTTWSSVRSMRIAGVAASARRRLPCWQCADC